MPYIDRYTQIERDAEWVINHFGSEAGERQMPGSKAKSQASRIAEGVRQLDAANELCNELDLITAQLHEAS